MKTASTTSRPGRPPDPGIEPRVLDATLQIYAEVGWAGFTMDAVARRARVGKAALYRRWESKEKLIVEALASITMPVMAETTGSLREDLLAMCVRTLKAQQSRDGLVGLRAQIEAKFYPELFGQAMEDLGKQWRTLSRRLVLLAIDRGEIPQGTSAGPGAGRGERHHRQPRSLHADRQDARPPGGRPPATPSGSSISCSPPSAIVPPRPPLTPTGPGLSFCVADAFRLNFTVRSRTPIP
ncbi:TetR/AcrR family transcriptional regulator [Nonomuraea ferruginea]